MRVPRKALRALRYILVALVVALVCWSRACSPPASTAAPRRGDEASQRARRADYAWGSILHRFENHPQPAKARRTLPWRDEHHQLARRQPPEPPAAHGRTRVLIVTSELSGLHKNGGIGTAFSELAQALAAADFDTSILVAHLADTFPVVKRETLVAELAGAGISLRFVEEEPQPFWPKAWTPTASMRVWRWLRARDGEFDVVHFPDNTGIGYFSSLAKQEGLALERTKLVVGLHGADVEWAAMLNKRYPVDKYAVELGVFEKRTAEWADAVVAPSDYMLEYARRRGWQLPHDSLVIPNVVEAPAVPPGETSTAVEPVTELVFFGRLEERKGTKLLIAALESLYSADEGPSPALGAVRQITFLGRDQPDVKSRTQVSALLTGALDAIKQYTNATFDFEFLGSYDRAEALSYLQNASRLALLPSLADNSPSTVLECIAHNIRFITSNVGGIPELVHPDDRDAVVAAPLVKPFARKLEQTLERLATDPWHPVRAAPETHTAAVDWVKFHHWLVSLPNPVVQPRTTDPLVSICVTHYERSHLVPQLLDSLLLQSYRNFEVVLIDDGSSSPDTLAALGELEARYMRNETLLAGRPPWHFRRIDNSYLGEARNVAASFAKGTYLLFLDDDDVLKPHALSTLVSVAHRTGASALSTWLDEFATDINPLVPRNESLEGGLPHRRTYWFLGQEVSAGLLSNSYGSGNIFVRRDAFDRIGGFSTYQEVGAEDWEFWTRLALQDDDKHLVVPEELIFARSDPARASMKFSMDPWDAHFHATVPLLNDPRVQELNLAPALMLLKSVVTREFSPPAFADSRRDFQLDQGWSGWFYSFHPANETLSLSPDRYAVPEGLSFVLDRDHPKKPYIEDQNQEGFVSVRQGPIAAVRTFRAPSHLDVAIEVWYRSFHSCGDGTRLSVVLIDGPGQAPQVLQEWATMDDQYAEWSGDATLRPGSTVSLVSDPLATDKCDRVEVHLKLTPISRENKSWSGLVRREAAKQAEAKKAAALLAAATPEGAAPGTVVANGSPTKLHMSVKEEVNDDDFFNVALIFDGNRFEHAQSVIRSVRHFTTSRKLVFHLIASHTLHGELEKWFEGSDDTLRLYDHMLCREAVRRVLPFSDPDIHVSAHCKMFLPEIISFAERVLYLDTDVTVVSDLAACYGKPLSTALVSMGVDMGDACQRFPDKCWPIGLHWRVPPGLQCGNVPERAAKERSAPASCAHTGELETLQVNGGVALFEIARMRESGFVDRYVQSVVHHYRLMDSTPARWGEQDFINSHFRLFPEDLELLPCGCNYQWFGVRREVKCGNQPVTIAHHWSHGIARRTKDPYNALFYHFADNKDVASLPPVPELSPSLPGAPNMSSIAVEHTLNCPRQSHDCNTPYTGTQYGRTVTVLSRITSETFAADQVDSLSSQSYSSVQQAIAFRKDAVDVPTLPYERLELDLPADPAQEYDVLCERCGSLAADGETCSSPPTDPGARKAYFDCVCALPDGNAQVMYDLEVHGRDTNGWVLYLDDSKLFVEPDSLSLLMARVDSPEHLVLFRSNTTSREQEYTFRQKVLPRSPLDGVGFLFHSSHLDLTAWSDDSRCGRWATLNRLASRLRLKWIDLVPTMEHPLQRHLPTTPAEAFKVSVVILETQGRISWTPLLLEFFQQPELEPLVADVVIASVDSESDVYGPEAVVVNPTVGSGLSELSELVSSDNVLLISDSVSIDKSVLTALLTFHLDDPSRLVGLFSEEGAGPESAPIDERDFAPPLVTNEDEFDAWTEPDALIGRPSWTHLLPRTLLTPRAHLAELSAVLAAAPEPLHPMCHPVLLSALSTRASHGAPPLRVLPPRGSVVDRVYDCRQRQFADVTYGRTAGDWAVPARAVAPRGAQDDVDEFDELTDEELEALVAAEMRGEAAADDSTDAAPEGHGDEEGDAPPAISEADFPPEPTLEECVSRVAELLGSDEWVVPGHEVGVAGPLGVRVGIERADEIEAERWQEARRMERCLRI
ncbi:uncharacterized protein JCM10292_001423 [Rhodotorula paludigena]|uniref:uncharacterized protein n=1 Tax=Rhodotorula paludigena TaxID=86838 RepID=UPI00317885FB